jgi:hypothetical protein
VEFAVESKVDSTGLRHPSNWGRFFLLATTEGRSLALIETLVLGCLAEGLSERLVSTVAAAVEVTTAGSAVE